VLPSAASVIRKLLPQGSWPALYQPEQIARSATKRPARAATSSALDWLERLHFSANSFQKRKQCGASRDRNHDPCGAIPCPRKIYFRAAWSCRQRHHHWPVSGFSCRATGLPFTRACQAGYARTFRLTAAGRESSATITFFQATMSVSSGAGFDSYRGGGYN